MRVICKRYPELDVADLGVRFCAGAADVTAEQAERLAQSEILFEDEQGMPLVPAASPPSGKRKNEANPDDHRD